MAELAQPADYGEVARQLLGERPLLCRREAFSPCPFCSKSQRRRKFVGAGIKPARKGGKREHCSVHGGGEGSRSSGSRGGSGGLNNRRWLWKTWCVGLWPWGTAGKSRLRPAGVRYESDALRGSLPSRPRFDDSAVGRIACPLLRALGRVMATSVCIPVTPIPAESGRAPSCPFGTG